LVRFPHDMPPNPRPTDVHLVSFPKSGNTWLRYLIAYAIWPCLERINLADMAAYVPSVNLPLDIMEMLDKEAPCNHLPHRIIKNHAPYSSRLHARNIIYLVRDGRDAIVSYWHFCNERDGTDNTLSQFLANSHQYGPWRDHMTNWMEAEVDRRLLIRYEDLIRDPQPTLESVLDFLGITHNTQDVRNAIDKSSFKKLREIEEDRGLGLDQLETVKFFRKGKIGSWEEEFGEGDLERFNKHHGGALPKYGYVW